MNSNFIDNFILETNSNVVVLSDLHIGIDSNHERVSLICDHIKELAKTNIVILNGDIFELWKYGSFGWNTKGEFSKLLELLQLYPAVLDILHMPTVYYIHGNHDFAVLSKDTTFKVYRSIVIGDTIIIHGNDADTYSNAYLAKREGLFLLSLFDYLTNQLYKLLNWGLKQDKAIGDIIFAATARDAVYEKYVASLLYTNVILGHTHKLGVKYLLSKDRVYYNSGSCLEQLQYLCISNSGIHMHTYPLNDN